jgi:hypothetical protein
MRNTLEGFKHSIPSEAVRTTLMQSDLQLQSAIFPSTKPEMVAYSSHDPLYASSKDIANGFCRDVGAQCRYE